jgi:thiol-disulfide isomerase/thioredoxin
LKPKLGRERWFPIALLIVLGWSLLMAFLRGGDNLATPRFDASQTGSRADFSWPVADLDGKPVDLGRYRGKAVFLNVWATWCGPCVAEMPSIARLSADPRLKDVAFVGVSVDDDDEPVRRFVKEHSLRFTILRATGPAPAAFATEGIPATFLIAPDGRIAARHVGSARWDSPEIVGLLARLATRSAEP